MKKQVESYEVAYNQIAETFDWKERQTKFIVNSVKVYEYFGYEFRLPFWDNELFSYWKDIGFNYRIGRKYYKKLFKKYLVVDQIKEIPFANDLLEKKKKMSFREIVKTRLPIYLKKYLNKKGYIKTRYFVGEGLHLIYADREDTVSEYLKSFKPPNILEDYLESEYKNKKLSDFPVNRVSTLLNIKDV